MNRNGRGRTWTLKERNQLEDLAGRFTLDVIARRLGRTRQAVACQMTALGISNKFTEGVSVPKLAEEWKVPPSRVSRMIKEGKIRAKRISSEHPWVIDPLEISEAAKMELTAPRKTWKNPLNTNQKRVVAGGEKWTIPSDRKDKPWGYEVVFASEEEYTGKILFIKHGMRLSKQKHTKKKETLCLLQGRALLLLDGELIRMQIGKGYLVEAGVVHRVTAIDNCLIVESSTPEIGVTIRLEDDSGRGDEILGSLPPVEAGKRRRVKDNSLYTASAF